MIPPFLRRLLRPLLEPLVFWWLDVCKEHRIRRHVEPDGPHGTGYSSFCPQCRLENWTT